MKAPLAFVILLLTGMAGLSPTVAQAPADEFKKLCISCHTIGGGRIVGPDLKDVHERKDRAWLVRLAKSHMTWGGSSIPMVVT